MKKIFYGIVCLLLVLSCVGCQATDAVPLAEDAVTPSASLPDTKIKVYTSFYAMYDFAKKIGGDKVDVTNLVPPNVEPHDWEPTPNDLMQLQTADVFIYNGLGMEGFIDKLEQSIDNEKIVFVKTTEFVDASKYNAEDLSHIAKDDSDDVFDAHVWLSPENALIQFKAIKDAFVSVDSKNKDYYEENFAAVSEQLAKLSEAYRTTLAPYAGKNVIVSHNAFYYLCHEYGINQISIEGAVKDSEPSPSKMVDIIRIMKTNNIHYILTDAFSSTKVATAIADEVGATLLPLSPFEALSEQQQEQNADYFSVMYQNLETLKTVLQ